MVLRLVNALHPKPKGTDSFYEHARQAVNASFRSGLYDKAVRGYSELLDAVERQSARACAAQHVHVLLTNRSCALEKLQQFGAAEEDARAAIAAQPAWLKGH
eukprot:1334619-Rhodomonas_salina.1